MVAGARPRGLAASLGAAILTVGRAVVRLVLFPVAGGLWTMLVGSILGLVAGTAIYPFQSQDFLDCLGALVVSGAMMGWLCGSFAFFLLALATLRAANGYAVFKSAVLQLPNLAATRVAAGGGGLGSICTVASALYLSIWDNGLNLSDLGQIFAATATIGACIGFLIGVFTAVSRGGEGEAKMQRLEADIAAYRAAATESKS